MREPACDPAVGGDPSRGTLRRIGGARLACLVLLACAHEPDAPTAPSPDAPGEPLPTGWKLHRTAAITFAGPAELVDQHAQGVDSAVGRLALDGMLVSFDYGWYSNSSFSDHFHMGTMSSGSREPVEIDSRPGWLATYGDNEDPAGLPFAVEIHVPAPRPSDPPPMRTSLQFKVAVRNEADLPAARRIACSVRFDPEVR